MPGEDYPFNIDERLDEGGMGVVYRGRHSMTELPVAIKVIKDPLSTEYELFQEEVQAQASLIHPNITYLFEYGRLSREMTPEFVDDSFLDNPFLAMEFAPDGVLRDVLPLETWSTLEGILEQVLTALAFSHARNVIHRDLKPENLLIFDRDSKIRIKLCDFGLAHVIGGERDEAGQELSFAGTPRYMAPEQVRGEWRVFGPWSDLYSLGCITWELVCGYTPFSGEDPVSTARQHLDADRPSLEPQFSVPRGLSGWVRRLIAVEPSDRFQTAADALR